jgi:hypothetical protein
MTRDTRPTPANDDSEADQLLWASGSVPVHQISGFELYMALQHINRLIWIAIALTRCETGEEVANVGIKAHAVLDTIFNGRQQEIQPPSQAEGDRLHYN